MKLSKSLLLIPAASLLLAAAVGSGACSSSVTVGTPVLVGTAPVGYVLDGYTVGSACSGDTYIADTSGGSWLVCDNGAWDYSTTDPSGLAGYSDYTGAAGTADDGGTAQGEGGSSGPDSGTGDTGTSGTDTGTSGTDTGTTGTDSGSTGVDSAATG